MSLKCPARPALCPPASPWPWRTLILTPRSCTWPATTSFSGKRMDNSWQQVCSNSSSSLSLCLSFFLSSLSPSLLFLFFFFSFSLLSSYFSQNLSSLFSENLSSLRIILLSSLFSPLSSLFCLLPSPISALTP